MKRALEPLAIWAACCAFAIAVQEALAGFLAERDPLTMGIRGQLVALAALALPLAIVRVFLYAGAPAWCAAAFIASAIRVYERRRAS